MTFVAVGYLLLSAGGASAHAPEPGVAPAEDARSAPLPLLQPLVDPLLQPLVDPVLEPVAPVAAGLLTDVHGVLVTVEPQSPPIGAVHGTVHGLVDSTGSLVGQLLPTPAPLPVPDVTGPDAATNATPSPSIDTGVAPSVVPPPVADSPGDDLGSLAMRRPVRETSSSEAVPSTNVDGTANAGETAPAEAPRPARSLPAAPLDACADLGAPTCAVAMLAVVTGTALPRMPVARAVTHTAERRIRTSNLQPGFFPD